MKRATLINDINEGGLKMPHIESMIEAQRIMCIQKFLDNYEVRSKTKLVFRLVDPLFRVVSSSSEFVASTFQIVSA